MHLNVYVSLRLCFFWWVRLRFLWPKRPSVTIPVVERGQCHSRSPERFHESRFRVFGVRQHADLQPCRLVGQRDPFHFSLASMRHSVSCTRRVLWAVRLRQVSIAPVMIHLTASVIRFSIFASLLLSGLACAPTLFRFPQVPPYPLRLPVFPEKASGTLLRPRRLRPHSARLDSISRRFPFGVVTYPPWRLCRPA